jgi:HK97 family phage major capsid protein
MKKSDQLKQQRAAAVQSQMDLANTAKTEKREMSDAEFQSFQDLDVQIRSLEDQISKAEMVEAAEARSAGLAGYVAPKGGSNGGGEHNEMDKILRNARLTDFLAEARNQPVDGASRELIEECKRQQKATGLEYRGVAIPASMLVAPEKRSASTVFNSNTSVPSPAGDFIDALRPYTAVVAAGARVITGLEGTVIMPRLKHGVAKWEGETTNNNDASGAGVDGVKLTPKRLTAKTAISKMLNKTSPLSLEEIFRNDLLMAQGEAVDLAAIAGASGGNSPVGIINFADVNAVVIGATGGAITYAKVLELLQKQMEANAYRPGMSFLTSPRTFTAMHNISKDAGSGKFLVEDGTIMGIPAVPSVHVPINLTKSSGNNLSALILGYFPALYIGQFGMFDLVVDPFTLADSGQDKIVLNGYWDIKAGNEKYFTVCKDITS